MSLRTLRGDHCQCGGCGEYFNSTKAFDKHRIGAGGGRRCRTPEEMLLVGMDRNTGGWWVGSLRANSRGDDLPPDEPKGGSDREPPTESEAA